MTELSELIQQRDALNRLIAKKETEDRKRQAALFLELEPITPDQIEMSDFSFNTVWDFAEHIRAKGRGKRKRYTEWNTLLFRTSELLDGRFERLPVTMSDVLPHPNTED